MTLPRPSRRWRAPIFAVILGLLLCVPSMAHAQRGIDETGDGRTTAPSADESRRIQQQAIDEAARMQAEEQQRQQEAQRAADAARVRPPGTGETQAQTGTGIRAADLTPVTPELSVPIPGLTFRPAYNEGNDVVVPYLADYISAVYKYLLGISTLVAIIVVIYGGFLYLLGQTVGSAKTGTALIKDALAGLVILYSSYLILYLINPNLVSLQPIRLTRINSVALGEASGIERDPSSSGQSGGGGGQCLRYLMGAGPYAQIPYGPSSQLANNFTRARRHNGRPVTDSDYSSFQEASCGPHSIASVLAYYGLKISIPTRVVGTADGSAVNAMHTVDPADVAIAAVLEDYREIGAGTDSDILSNIPRLFPQFDANRIDRSNTQGILTALRNRHPLVFGCSHVHLCDDEACAVPAVSRESDRHTDLYRPGHYMVISEAISDSVLRVHDVGRSNTVAISMNELQNGTYTKDDGSTRHVCGDVVEIVPKATYAETVTASWGKESEVTQIQMQLPATAATVGGQCRSSSRRSGNAPAGSIPGEVDKLSFTYRPSGQDAANWPDNAARIIYPKRLQNTSGARVHVMIYLHGDNDDNGTPESRYLTYLEPSLRQVAGGKDVVIFTPHHNRGGNDYTGFNVSQFYSQAMEKLATIMPGVTAIDTVIGGHSGATCKGGPVLVSGSGSLPNLRGIIAYDGCAGGPLTPTGQWLSPNNLNPGSGVAVYINSDISGMGSGRVASASGGQTQRHLEVRSLWGLTAQTCPACATQVSSGTTCYGRDANFSRERGSGELISFETGARHGPSVGVMTNIALCAFYQNTTGGAPATP